MKLLTLLVLWSKHSPSHLECMVTGYLLRHLVLLGRLESRLENTLVYTRLLKKLVQVRLEIFETILELSLFVNQATNLGVH